MKFLRYIFTGWLLFFTLIFNGGTIFYFYQLFFNPQSFYQGMVIMGTIAVLGIETIYWVYCIKNFKNKN